MKERKDLLKEFEKMHLQWFAQDDDDDEIEIEDDDDVEFLVEGRDEIPEETVEEEGPSREDLQRELNELKERQSLVAGQLGDRKSLEDGFNKLSQVLTEQRANQGLPENEQVPSWEEVKKQLGKNFYDDPMNAIEQAINHAVKYDIAPAFRQTQDMVSKTAISTSKHAAASNDMNKMIMDRFNDEVEETVKKLPHSPDVYEKACQQVGMNHLTDIVAFQVDEAMKNSGSPTLAKRPSSNVMPSSVVTTGKSTSKERRILTKDQREWADKKGVAYEDAWAVFNAK